MRSRQQGPHFLSYSSSVFLSSFAFSGRMVQHSYTRSIPLLYYPENYCQFFILHSPFFILHSIYPHTLTLTLTTETPINRAFQPYCEGVRATK